jgi:predicted ATP-grasp superfamily ATP-dependent carboligase
MMGGYEDRDAVLVPTGYDPASYVTVRSLGGLGVHPIVASQYDDVPAMSSRFCGETARIPAPEDDLVAYKDALVELAARPDVRTVVAIRPYDPYVFAKYREEFEEHVTLVTPSLPSVRTVFDRMRLAEAAESAGVPVPETRLLGDVDGWDGEFIVKSRYNLLADEFVDSHSPAESTVVKTIEHVRTGDRPDAGALREEMGHEPIVQEYVRSSDEYLFGALYDQGEAVSTFQHRQVRGNSYTGGGGVYRESVDIPALDDAGRTLLDSLDWHGPACIEYMRDAETGEFVLAEINPRLWQSLPVAVRSGADFPAHQWHLATDRRDRIEPGYDVGVGSHLLYGELGYLLSILNDESALVERPSLARSTAEILRSCVEMPYFDILHLDDPGPFLSGLRHVAKKL